MQLIALILLGSVLGFIGAGLRFLIRNDPNLVPALLFQHPPWVE